MIVRKSESFQRVKPTIYKHMESLSYVYKIIDTIIVTYSNS